MAKKITNYSKLSKDNKAYVNSLLERSALKIIEVNLNKGVIIELEKEVFFVVLDTWTGFDKRLEKDSDMEWDEEGYDDLAADLLSDKFN
jgi:hypothetical protein